MAWFSKKACGHRRDLVEDNAVDVTKGSAGKESELSGTRMGMMMVAFDDEAGVLSNCTRWNLE